MTLTARGGRYELRAVEGALATAVRSYEAEVAALEARLLPCLRSLLHKLSRGELNVLRHCKSTLNKLLGRMRLCRKVRRPPRRPFCLSSIVAVCAFSGALLYSLPLPGQGRLATGLHASSRCLAVARMQRCVAQALLHPHGGLTARVLTLEPRIHLRR